MRQSEMCAAQTPYRLNDHPGNRDAETSTHESGDSSWESAWIDLGGEG